MGGRTGIEWTDHTWNPWHGCIKISPGCKLCYMYREKERYGQDPSIVVRSKTTFNAPLKWKDPAMVFTCSWSDFFIEEADAWRNEAWHIIQQTPHLTYQILTKRPGRIIEHLPPDWGDGYRNVWFGVSGETHEWFLKRWRILRGVRAALRFVSLEPLLGPVSLAESGTVPDWVIAGGETGLQARFTDLMWLRRIRADCEGARIPFFLKQITLGGRPIPFEKWPEDLRIREFPQ